MKQGMLCSIVLALCMCFSSSAQSETSSTSSKTPMCDVVNLTAHASAKDGYTDLAAEVYCANPAGFRLYLAYVSGAFMRDIYYADSPMHTMVYFTVINSDLNTGALVLKPIKL